MNKELKDFSFLFLVSAFIASVTVTVARLSNLDWVIFQDEFKFAYPSLLMLLFFAPVVFTTIKFGFKSGVIACLIMGLLMLLQAINSLQAPDLLPGFIAIVAIGISASWLIDRQEKGERLAKRRAGELRCQTAELKNELTNHQQMEEKLRESQEKLQRIFESVPDGITVTDLNYVITEVNERMAEIHGVGSKEELIGENSFALVASSDREKVMTDVSEIVRNGSNASIECRLLKADGSEFPAEISTSMLKDTDGKSVGFIIITRDTTEQKRAQEQLQHAHLLASLGEMTAGIAHEVNNPLGSILLYSEMLLTSDVAAQTRKDLRVIHEEAKRAAKVMTDLLTYGHRVSPKIRRVDLRKIIEKVLDMRRYQEAVQNISVFCNLPYGSILVKGNSSQLTQVFMNLMLNAEDFLGKSNGGNIVINAQIDEKWAKVSITDDGIGIPKKHLAQVFHPFFTTKRVGEGTGLGLSTCYGIITAHKGLIHAENNETGGTTIIVELPLAQISEREDKQKKQQGSGLAIIGMQ